MFKAVICMKCRCWKKIGRKPSNSLSNWVASDCEIYGTSWWFLFFKCQEFDKNSWFIRYNLNIFSKNKHKVPIFFYISRIYHWTSILFFLSNFFSQRTGQNCSPDRVNMASLKKFIVGAILFCVGLQICSAFPSDLRSRLMPRRDESKSNVQNWQFDRY